MAKHRVVWASLAVTDTASRMRMYHTTPSALTVLRLLRVGSDSCLQTHYRSITLLSVDLPLVHCLCIPRLPSSPLQHACNRSVISPFSAYHWPSLPGARSRMCVTRIPQRGETTALEDPVSPGRNRDRTPARSRRCRRPAPEARGTRIGCSRTARRSTPPLLPLRARIWDMNVIWPRDVVA